MHNPNYGPEPLKKPFVLYRDESETADFLAAKKICDVISFDMSFYPEDGASVVNQFSGESFHLDQLGLVMYQKLMHAADLLWDPRQLNSVRKEASALQDQLKAWFIEHRIEAYSTLLN